MTQAERFAVGKLKLYWPRGHSTLCAEPPVQYEPSGQSAQPSLSALEPNLALNVPGSHLMTAHAVPLPGEK